MRNIGVKFAIRKTKRGFKGFVIENSYNTKRRKIIQNETH